MNHKPVLYVLIGLLAGSVATALVALLTLKPFSSASQSSPNVVATDPTSPTVPVRGGMMGQSDQHFMVMMIPHHEGAIAMADLAFRKAKHPELKQLAQAIKTTQTQEIQQMRTWYKQWYGTDVPAWGPGNRWGWFQTQAGNTQQPVWGSGMERYQNWDEWNRRWRPGMMHGMMGNQWMGANLYALQNAPDFDREFIQQMIPHHQMGVMMATMVLNSSQRSEIRTLAQSIIKSQTDEINQMQQWYQTWYQ